MEYSLEKIFTGKSVTLLGAGISNMPLAELISPVAGRLTVRDRKNEADLGKSAEKLRALGAELILGDDYLHDIDEDVIFRSPGIRPDVPELTDAVRRGAMLTSEMELFLEHCPCPVYAITGSDGKTTTTTLTSLMLKEGGGEVFLGGNIGEPLLHRLSLMSKTSSVAVELSSFQLMTAYAPVEVAAITNITPNHLNWHTGMNEYTEAKKRILVHAKRAVLNYDNDITREIAESVREKLPVTLFSLAPIPTNVREKFHSAVWLENGAVFSDFPGDGKVEIMKRSDIKIPGLHNIANYLTAIAVTHGRVSADGIRKIAREFGGVEHRLEFVRELDGITYINGSIDSSPTRTAAALSAVSDRPVVLIAGGYDKHIPYGPLADAVFSSSVRAVVLTGDTADAINSALIEHPMYDAKTANGFTVLKNPSFEGALTDARNIAQNGDTVLLSPASASFDRFPNFEVRGRYFKELVLSFK